MISTEILEPNRHRSYKAIYYRDQNDKVIRHVWVDDDNRIIRDYLYERRKDGQCSCVVLFGPDYITPIGIQEIVYDNLDRRIEAIQYEVCDGKKIPIQKSIFYYEAEAERCYKVVVYSRAEEPVGYVLYTYDDAGVAPVGYYNMKDEPIRKFNLERLF
ncbi:hypothetical protein [Methylovulum psychrotolerans]|uniref:Uncharacterized protein n=1 Tax=Methylovulum psychrotolerans TaxID=1704499 RepID=A0A1Z4C4U7_9GAMM|nr:hypothetical protein [Methylovulum psychrotolerans]ASF48549.1 hypothetical protein CEK71_22200 [Methylovulum psychrotolerans]POZ49839.1 hypothetical protein AADEFJLK_04399 [Methylovulum psychrotolerans]